MLIKTATYYKLRILYVDNLCYLLCVLYHSNGQLVNIMLNAVSFPLPDDVISACGCPDIMKWKEPNTILKHIAFMIEKWL